MVLTDCAMEVMPVHKQYRHSKMLRLLLVPSLHDLYHLQPHQPADHNVPPWPAASPAGAQRFPPPEACMHACCPALL